MRLITQVTALDSSSVLLKRFPRSGFFSFGNKSKSGGLSPPDFDWKFERVKPNKRVVKRKFEGVKCR
jgi:hypothetical protein